MSAATESTLAELLDVARQTNVNIANLSRLIAQANTRQNTRQSQDLPASNAAANLLSLASSLSPVSLALRAFSLPLTLASRGLGVLGSVAGSLVGTVTDLATNLTNFALNASNSGATMSGFFSVFSRLPLGLGTLASLFSNITSYGEGLLNSYRQLTQVGASFGGSLTDMRNMAAQSGLTMDQFSKVVKNNSDIFSSMGGGVDAGVKKFTEQSGKLLDTNGPFAARLAGLGYTAEESANLLVTYYRTQGSMSAKQLANFNQVGQSTVQLAEQMDLMSKITGRSRKEQEESMKKLQADQLWQSFKQQLDPAARAAAEATITAAEGVFGPDFADSLKVGMQTGFFNPISEAARMQVAGTGGLSQEVGQQMIEMIKSGKTLEQVTAVLINGGKKAGEYSDQLNQATGGAINYNAALKSALAPAMAFAIKTKNQTTEQLVADAKAQQAKQQAEASQAARLAVAQQNLQNFVNQFTIILNGIIGPLLVPLQELGTSLIRYLKPGVEALAGFFQSDSFKNGLKNIIGWFSDTFTRLKTVNSVEDLRLVLKEQGKKAFDGIVDTLMPLFNAIIRPAMEKLWTEIKPPLLTFFKDMFEDLLIMLKETINRLSPTQLFDVKTDKENRDISRSKEFALLKQYLEEKNRIKIVDSDTQSLINMLKNMTDPKNAEAKRLFEEWKASQANQAAQGAPVATPLNRASGSLGSVGRLIENFGSGTPAMLHGEEGVVTRDQMNQIISGAVQMGQQTKSSGNNTEGLEKITSMLASALQQLAVLMKENNEYTRRNLDATRELSGNLWAS
jgi:hypothetical protein